MLSPTHPMHCEGLKELTPVNVSNIVANEGKVCIATRDFSEKSAGMDAGGMPEGARSGPVFWQALHGNVARGHTKVI